MATCKKSKAAAEKKAAPVKHIGIVKNDPWLEPFEAAICGRHDHALWKLNELTQNGKQTLSDFASGYLYFGLHKTSKGWVLREWAPNATDIYLVGDFNGWQEDEAYKMTRIDNGNWEIKLKTSQMHHGDLFKLKIKWNGGEGERIPSYANRVVQAKPPRFSPLKYGHHPNLTSSRRRTSSPTPIRCSSTSATSEWDRMRKRWALTRNSRTISCHASRRTATMPYR